MNKLKPEKQETVIRCLVDGSSVRATERIAGVHRDTILRLMVRVGNGCEKLMDERRVATTNLFGVETGLHICPALNASGIKPSTHRGKSLLICAEIGYYSQQQRMLDFLEPDLQG